MSNMTTKSDFAQKLLGDLRLRKEKMAAAHNSGRQSSQTSRVMRGNSGQTSRSTRQINALESAASVTAKTSRRSSGGSRSVNNIKESSNQIVLYEGGGQSSKQVRDLSMAIALAFENSGNLIKIGGSSSNPLVNFFNRFGRRSLNFQKMEITSFNNQSTSQFPTVSHIHITEISKGVHKLNQILRACSNGLNFDRNSIEVGKQLLKGAIDLEESLRMLVNMQDASQYVNGSQKKSRIKLLEEDEDDEDDMNNKRDDQWKLDRPRFSFDKPSKNSHLVQGGTRRQQLALTYPSETSEQVIGGSKLVPYRRSTSYIQDSSLSTQVKLNNSSSSQSTQEKGRISNVIAKLMGLEELPLNDDSTRVKSDSKVKEGKQGKVSRENTKLRESLTRESRNGSLSSTNKKSALTNNAPPIRESRLQLKPEKSQETTDRSSKMVNSERNQQRKELKILEVGVEAASDRRLATITTDNQGNHIFAANQVNRLQSFEDSGSKQSLRGDKQGKVIESQSELLVLNTELQKKVQNSKALKAEQKTHNRIEQEVSANSLEKRNADKHLPSNQKKPQDQHALLQEQALKRAESSEDKRRAEQKGQQFQKQNLMAKDHEGKKVESIIGSKSKGSTAMNGQKKLSGDKSAPGNRKSMKPGEKLPMKDPPDMKQQDAALIIDISQKTASNQQNVEKEDQSHNSSIREPETEIEKGPSNQLLRKEKPIEVSDIQKRSIPRKVQRNEIPQKIDVLMTRRNATANHQTRSIKKPASLLKDLKHQMHNKNRSSKRMEEQSDSKVEEGKAGISVYNAAQMTSEPVKQNDKLQNEDDQTVKLNSTIADEYQTENIQKTLSLNDNCDVIVLSSGKVSDDFQTVEKSCALKGEEELTQCHQSIGAHEESTDLYDLSQHGYKQCPASERQEPLTEPEKHLKETVIKSQLFLSTAEALFKLNIPVSFLHAGDHDKEAAETKLLLDCAYEVMKRKARRHEVACHPYMKTTISSMKVRSLDDLVKRLCKDIEMLKFYGMNGSDECDVAAGLYKMLSKDIYNENPDVNTMWDFEWSKMMSVFPEMEDVIRDVERHMLNGLLDEITNDLLLITVSV